MATLIIWRRGLRTSMAMSLFRSVEAPSIGLPQMKP